MAFIYFYNSDWLCDGTVAFYYLRSLVNTLIPSYLCPKIYTAVFLYFYLDVKMTKFIYLSNNIKNENMTRKDEKTRWTTIKVPATIRDRLKAQAAGRKMALWKLVLDATSFYLEARRKHFSIEALELDKVAWYIFKISASVGAFKENPTKANYEFLEKNCKRINEMFGVDCSVLLTAAEKYMKRRTKKNRVPLNMATKDIIKQILASKS